MVNHQGCINGTLQGVENYSAPVPVIGHYIASASVLCALLMLYDIVLYGFIKNQRWFPCIWFKLNSVTLSLIGVVVKLTVDLTTPMPSGLDQLSKLAGSTSLCIYMCYIFPSIPEMKDPTNMFALSILVITVFVNMCIQLSTGVIELFIPEHVVILCIMLVLLLILWRMVFLGKNERRDSVATCKSDFMAGEYKRRGGVTPSSFLQRLKVCYLKNYKANPQFIACKRFDCGMVGDFSLISLAILIQAAIRSIILKKEILCTRESSDYQWSMWLIVVTQIIFIIIGSFASYFRRLTMLRHTNVFKAAYLIEEPYSTNPLLKGKFSLVICVEYWYLVIIIINWSLLFTLVMFLSWVLSSMRKVFNRVVIKVKYFTSSEEARVNTLYDSDTEDIEFETYKDFIDRLNESGGVWLMRKSESSMEKLIEGSKKKSNGLSNLLSGIIPVNSVIGSFNVAVDSQEPTQEGQLPPAKLHPLVVLVRLMEVIIPENPSQDRIVKTLRETFATLHFIEKHMHTTSEDLKQTEIAKALWMAGDFGCLLPDYVRSSYEFPQPVTVSHAFSLLAQIHGRMCEKDSDSVSKTVGVIRGFLEERSYSSVNEVGNFMQDLFVYMLNVMLAQLPEAIFKAVSQSPEDEFEERVRQSLKHLSMLQSWDGIRKWKPPQGLENCTGLFDPEEAAAPNVVSPNDAPTSLNQENPPVKDEGEDLSLTLRAANDILSLEEHHVTINEDDGIVKFPIM